MYNKWRNKESSTFILEYCKFYVNFINRMLLYWNLFIFCSKNIMHRYDTGIENKERSFV